MPRRSGSGAAVERLLATAQRVAESLDLQTVLASIVEDARSLLSADSGDMLLWDHERDRLRVVAVSQRPTELLGFEMPFGEGMSTQAILARRAIWVDDYREYPHRARALDRYEFGSVICAPLIFRGNALGALNLHATRGGHRFDADDAAILGAFAGHAAIALDHAKRYENEVALGRALADANSELSRSMTVQQRLAEQVLLDAGPRGIADVLAAHLGRRVVIQDDFRRVIAGASPNGTDDWQDLVDSSSVPPPLSVPVRLGRDLAGHLLVSSEQDLGPIDRALVDVAVTGVALEFAKIRASIEVEERLRGEAIADLLNGTYPDEAAIAARAARLGNDLARPHDLIVVDVQSGGIDGRAIVAVRELLAKRVPRSLTVLHSGVIVVLALHPRRDRLDARALAVELQSTLEGTAGTGAVTISLGGTSDRPDAYAPAYAAARRALELMLKLGRTGAVISASELGPYGLLLEASDRGELETFARGALGPILNHDREHGSDLIRTLRIYLEEDRVQRRAAERCFVHVNTIAYRIGQIERHLRRSLGDPGTVFDLTFALKILDVVDAGSDAGAGASAATRRNRDAAPPR